MSSDPAADEFGFRRGELNVARASRKAAALDYEPLQGISAVCDVHRSEGDHFNTDEGEGATCIGD
jgi:hypothetical protein